MKFFKVAPFETAQKTVIDNFDLDGLTSEVVSLEKAVGRRAYKDILSPESLPEYNRSTVDGYAVCAANTYGATDSVPSMLTVLGKVEMGVVGAYKVAAGQAVYVPTGGEVPQGADAMVMIENTELFGDNVAIYKPAAVRDNVISVGDDIEAGERILKKGERITPLKSGLLAALGITRIEVYRPITVAIISTGDEIVGVDEKTQKGQIRDTNTTINRALCTEGGFEIACETRIKDGFELLDDALTAAATAADIVLISGGSSIGARDFTEQVLEKEGEILIHGIALKPGKPTLIARVRDKLVFGLPGHPMACLLTLKLLVIGSVNKLFGEKEDKFLFAETSINFPSSPGRLTVQPVSLSYEENKVTATPLFYKSGLVSVLADADGYTLIPSEQEGIYKGQKIKIYLL